MEDASVRLIHAARLDMAQRLTGVTDHGGAVWAHADDMLGNRLAVAGPDLGAWSYGYNLADRPTSQTDARGRSAPTPTATWSPTAPARSPGMRPTGWRK